MKYIIPTFLFSAILLAGCQQVPPAQEYSMTSSSALSANTSSAQYIHWKTYQDTKLGIRMDYPFDEYTVTPTDDYIQFGDKKITIEGVRIGDNMPEGNGVQLYRTKDANILGFLQQDKPFSGKKTVRGTDYQEFELLGLGDVYGYLTEKNEYYYVFQSMWGPDNTVSEKMLESLQFEKI